MPLKCCYTNSVATNSPETTKSEQRKHTYLTRVIITFPHLRKCIIHNLPLQVKKKMTATGFSLKNLLVFEISGNQQFCQDVWRQGPARPEQTDVICKFTRLSTNLRPKINHRIRPVWYFDRSVKPTPYLMPWLISELDTKHLPSFARLCLAIRH